MTRICPKCGYENKDEYKHCCKCGQALLAIRKSSLIIFYILTIAMSWGGLIFHTYFVFVGCFFPFFLLQSSNSTLRKHGIILLLISVIGIFLTIYTMFLR